MEPFKDSLTSRPCHFFHIPAELRNSIYEYALTEKHPLQVERRGIDTSFRCYKKSIAQAGDHHDTNTFAISLTDALLEVNQLRFVNKQLYAETRGLALRFNDLSFDDIEDANCFLESCTLSHQARIRVLIVHWTGRWSPALHEAAPMELVAQFCETHSQATVRIEISSFGPNVPSLLMYIALDEIRLRGTQTLIDAILAPESGLREQSIRSARRVTKEGKKLFEYPKNIRYFYGAGCFDEKAFREGDLKEKIMGPLLAIGALPWNAVELVKLMKQVIEHGI